MNWFNNLKIKSKLLISFSLTLILTIVVGFMGYSSLNKIIPQFKSMYEDRLVPTMDLTDILQDMYEVRISVLNHYISEDSLAMLDLENKIKEYESIIDGKVDKYSKTYLVDEEVSKLDEFRKNLNEYRNFRSEVLSLSLSGMKEEAKSLMYGKAGQQFKETADNSMELIDIQGKVGSELYEESRQISDTASLSLIIAIIVAVIFGLSIAVFIAGKIGRSVKELAEKADLVTHGDLSVEINSYYNDEVGNLAGSMNKMVKSIKTGIEELNKEKVSIENKVLEAVKESEAQKNYLTANVDLMLVEMNRFSEGDLTVRLNVEKEDEIGKLFIGFNRVVSNIKNLVQQLTEAIQATASSSTEISSSTEEMAAGAQEQSAQTGEVATAIEQMTKTIIETTRNASTAAENAQKAGKIADEGGRVVEETVAGINKIAVVVSQSAETVKKLGKSSDQIGEIVQVIDDIADQTNLLALNAAIEAARAGEQGRGFAVVADEVRKLAERTTKATKEIADMIKQIQKDTVEAVDSMNKGTEEVEKGKELANRAGKSLKDIISASTRVLDDVTQVATASEEQSSTAEQISKSIEAISNVTNETSSGIQQVARAAEDLNRLTENLHKLVGQFKTDTQEDVSHFSVRNNRKLIEV